VLCSNVDASRARSLSARARSSVRNHWRKRRKLGMLRANSSCRDALAVTGDFDPVCLLDGAHIARHDGVAVVMTDWSVSSRRPAWRSSSLRRGATRRILARPTPASARMYIQPKSSSYHRDDSFADVT
jgi:hypothetical protein